MTDLVDDWYASLDSLYAQGWNDKGRRDYDPRGNDSWCHLLNLMQDEHRERKNTVAMCQELQDEIERLRSKYSELLMAVAAKNPNETRHETALRYIMLHEARRALAAEEGE